MTAIPVKPGQLWITPGEWVVMPIFAAEVRYQWVCHVLWAPGYVVFPRKISIAFETVGAHVGSWKLIGDVP